MQVLVFDFFGVICSEIAPFVLPKYMSPEDAVAYKASVVYDADLGRISQDEMFARLSEITGASPRQLEDEFWSHATIDAETVALIEDLRTRHRVALLTNAIVPFFRQLAAQHDLERLFEIILVSSEEGMAKPDPAFYGRMVERLRVPPQDCLFMDDNPVNLTGAEQVGMRALLFESAAKLKRDLSDLL
jgi:HAD superfamily hydrolase (TIGR01509 family)